VRPRRFEVEADGGGERYGLRAEEDAGSRDAKVGKIVLSWDPKRTGGGRATGGGEVHLVFDVVESCEAEMRMSSEGRNSGEIIMLNGWALEEGAIEVGVVEGRVVGVRVVEARTKDCSQRKKFHFLEYCTRLVFDPIRADGHLRLMPIDI
jgi:hypothetical protein